MSVPFVFPLAMTSYCISSYLIVAITVQRYLVVTHPIRARAYFTKRRTRWVCFWIVLLSIIYNGPRWDEYSYNGVKVSDWATGSNSTEDWMYMPLTTGFRRSYAFDKVYVQQGFFLFIYFIPMSTMVVLNLLIYRGEIGRAHV